MLYELVLYIFIYNMLTYVTINKIIMKYLQVVQEYERAVIFRLGRLMSGGAKGPGE